MGLERLNHVFLRSYAMKHQQYKEWLQLNFYGELEQGEQSLLDKHLNECSECRSELEELRGLGALLSRHVPLQASGELLREARRELRAALRIMNSRVTFWDRLKQIVGKLALLQYRLAYATVGALAVGFLLGGVLLHPPVHERGVDMVSSGTTPFVEGETRITNVRFVEPAAADGEVEFTFEAVAPMRMKGNLSEPRIQKVLAHALVNELNPGVRLQTVSIIGVHAEGWSDPDPEVLAALINALKSDPNAGVRMEALSVLQKFPYNEEIKAAILYVLMNDDNSGVRIAAINAIDKAREEGRTMGKDALRVLREKMQTDNNNYVRIRAMNVLHEIGER